jgi:hypothetical protein
MARARLLAVPLLALALLGAKAPAPDARTLALRNAVLKSRVELAKGEAFYLLLDVARSKLTLQLRGATLAVYDVRQLEVGLPRVAWIGRGDAASWQGRTWTGGTLVPERQRERLEIVATPGMSTEEAEARVPPTPEEIYEVPPRRFLVRFAEGVSLEVRPVGVAASGWGNWLRDIFAAMKPTPDDRLRLRVVLTKESFDAMFRSLPPGVKLLVLPPVAGA